MSPNEITSELIREDAKSRVAKTGGQVGGATALVTVGEWVAGQAGWHGELPVVVAGAMVTLLTIAASYLTNLSRLRA